MSDGFSQLSRETIGQYVYALVDPRAEGSAFERIFYIGKGIGNRCHAHARQELGAEVADSQMKLSTIRAIREETGRAPPIFIVAHGLKTEEETLRLEAILIATLGLRRLTNVVRGQGDRDVWLPADELDARYATPVSLSAISETILFVSLNGGPNLPPYPQIKDDPDVLAHRTLGFWPISAKNASRVDLVVGVYRGLTRCAYRVKKRPDGQPTFTVTPPSRLGGRSRVCFEGELLADWPHLLRRIENDVGDVLTVFSPQSACRLV